MTIKTSGQLSMAEINAEFGLGTNLYAYRGVKWYRDDNTRGFFEGASGNNPPIDFYEFYGKRKTIPVTPTGDVAYSNGQWFSVPFYNKITIVIVGGQAGAKGPNGYDGEGRYPTSGSDGNSGNPSYFYGYKADGGSPNSGVGATTTIVFNAEANNITVNGSVVSGAPPFCGISIICQVGSGGAGGRGGYNRPYRDFPYPFDYLDGWYTEENGSFGAQGSSGSCTIRVE